MSSQLSIQIDPRAPEPSQPPGHGFGPPAHQPAFSPSHRGHQHSRTVSGRLNMSATQGRWDESVQHHNADFSAYHHASPQRFPPRFVNRQGPSSPNFARRGPGMLYNHRRDPHSDGYSPEAISSQSNLLDELCYGVVSNSEIERSEIAEKEDFRQRIEAISREAIARFEMQHHMNDGFQSDSVQLKCFGSLSSGFATKASDMDLGLLSPLSKVRPDEPDSPIPRLLEKALLDAGLGARLLTRTRVPIIKLCSEPPQKLLQDLLAERQKWEAGLDIDYQDGHDDDEVDQDGAPMAQDQDLHEVESADASTTFTAHFELPSILDGEMQQYKLKQGPRHSLQNYYASAKRILRKAGGHDITISNYRDFSDQDWVILNKVSRAFVEGLSNSTLRQRLASYRSLSFEPMYDLPINRSLYGVSLQVEGEDILYALESWPGKDFFQQSQSQLEQAVRSWRLTQNKASFGDDPIAYNKELQLALNKFKRLPIVQLLILEQSQYETPLQYSSRAKQVLSSLNSSETALHSEARAILVRKYVSGVFHLPLRESLQVSLDEHPDLRCLEGVTQRHKSLHLAQEFERALEKDLYNEEDIESIKLYITLLKGPLQQATSSSTKPAFIVPVPSHLSDIVAKIRILRDPHNLAPNQPRDRYRDRLEFPKSGAGVQCDINFSAHLALQNTLLLRCYSHSDGRVKPMVLFIKHWAKVRGINSGYRGTLSSYGYVLMVLHYLVNIVQPFVCPNLQQLAPHAPPNPSPAEVESSLICRGYNVQFWRNEEEIMTYAQSNQLNQNHETIGCLLRGFFEYYAQSGPMSSGSRKGFDWGRDVLSLRTPGGLLSKQFKGWTGAKVEVQALAGASTEHGDIAEKEVSRPIQHITSLPSVPDGNGPSKPTPALSKDKGTKEVRHRYLFAIEDPFELDHNVARTVTHNGIVSIRDEFRRAWRIIRTGGNGNFTESLLDDVNESKDNSEPFNRLLDDIHGLRGASG